MKTHERFQEEIDQLRTLRDELRVQMNLAAKDARDLFEEMESRWIDLEAHLKGIGRESRDAMHDVEDAGRKLAHEIRRAYERIRAQT